MSWFTEAAPTLAQKAAPAAAAAAMPPATSHPTHVPVSWKPLPASAPATATRSTSAERLAARTVLAQQPNLKYVYYKAIEGTPDYMDIQPSADITSICPTPQRYLVIYKNDEGQERVLAVYYCNDKWYPSTFKSTWNTDVKRPLGISLSSLQGALNEMLARYGKTYAVPLSAAASVELDASQPGYFALPASRQPALPAAAFVKWDASQPSVGLGHSTLPAAALPHAPSHPTHVPVPWEAEQKSFQPSAAAAAMVPGTPNLGLVSTKPFSMVDIPPASQNAPEPCTDETAARAVLALNPSTNKRYAYFEAKEGTPKYIQNPPSEYIKKLCHPTQPSVYIAMYKNEQGEERKVIVFNCNGKWYPATIQESWGNASGDPLKTNLSSLTSALNVMLTNNGRNYTLLPAATKEANYVELMISGPGFRLNAETGLADDEKEAFARINNGITSANKRWLYSIYKLPSVAGVSQYEILYFNHMAASTGIPVRIRIKEVQTAQGLMYSQVPEGSKQFDNIPALLSYLQVGNIIPAPKLISAAPGSDILVPEEFEKNRRSALAMITDCKDPAVLAGVLKLLRGDQQKYLKYKQKYLQLKKLLQNNN
jgi:hypothetical protein